MKYLASTNTYKNENFIINDNKNIKNNNEIYLNKDSNLKHNDSNFKSYSPFSNKKN